MLTLPRHSGQQLSESIAPSFSVADDDPDDCGGRSEAAGTDVADMVVGVGADACERAAVG